MKPFTNQMRCPATILRMLIAAVCLLSVVSSPAQAPTPWDRGVVYFDLDPAMDSVQKNKVRSAMDVWSQSSADIVFLPRNGLANVPYLNVTLVLTNGNYTQGSGMPAAGSARTLNLNDRGMNNNWYRLHELGHALGFLHEMKRPDRDTYLTIHLANIDNDDEGQYNPKTSDHMYDTGTYPFCIESIMMYAQCNNTEGSCTNCPNDNTCTAGGANMTVLPPNESWQNKMGTDGWNSSTSVLPACDIDRAVSVYGSGSVRYVDKVSGGESLGTLRAPYKTFGEARDNAPSGARVYLEGDTYTPSSTVLNRPLQWRAYPNTTVRIE